MRWLFLAFFTVFAAFGEERQLTQEARNHALDNNDNFSAGDRFLCFDIRGSGQAIMKADAKTGEETLIYGPGPQVVAASYVPGSDSVVFIHGPIGQPYAKTNRRGAEVDVNGKMHYLDYRDIASPVTPPGAHRGGTHRHEYSGNGKRVAFTYDDHLLPAYGRTIGMLVPHPKAPGGVSHWFTVLVPVVPEASAKPGDLVMAASDSWVGKQGLMRGFIGKVKETDGSFKNSLFVVDVPANVDVTTAFAGDATHYPTPPNGVRVRRLTTTEVSAGNVRGSSDGKWISYLASAGDGSKQIFVISSKGGTPRQVSHVAGGVLGAVRWHPSNKYLAASAKSGVIVVNVATGKTAVLTEKGGDALVWSNDGKTLAYNRRVGQYQQIFLSTFDGGF
ncbi:MAG TPA: DUF3748 domain-containing protein [Bryobacteraceae bacterium]|nr:DUF3748 domain-containing protein [Bryobacteraceae bacterium]